MTGLAMATLVLAMAWPHAGDAQEAAVRTRVPGVLAGTWVYDGTPAHGMAIVDAAFAPGIATLPGLFQGIARDRIHGSMQPPPRVEVALTGQQVRVSFVGETTKVIDGALGSVATTTGVHEGTRVSTHLRGGWLELRYEGEGDLTQLLSTTRDGARMHVDYTVVSDRLPDPVRYRLDFVHPH